MNDERTRTRRHRACRRKRPHRDLLLRSATLITAYVVAYVVLDFVSYVHRVAPFAITPWNPPPGVSLALLLARHVLDRHADKDVERMVEPIAQFLVPLFFVNKEARTRFTAFGTAVVSPTYPLAMLR